ncbi:sigma-54-dependent Fis family transcriptional regulator [candidate division KSB1 bacterium]|nr:MAG: sigma-54-dependent Fis family transcriptional regulator [candidate division KSB1 bacterium]
MKTRILVVDDERSIRDSLKMVLQEEGYPAQSACDGKEALHLLHQENFDILITDLKMPEMDGLELTKQCLQAYPKIAVIIITAYGSLDSAIKALRLGAHDYILKPFDFDDVLLKVQRIIQQKELILENKVLRREIHTRYDFSNIVGQSPQMQKVFDLIRKVANTKGNVLITGKSGTGKELVARAIHFNSDRANKPFVPINCGAIVGTLMESEFFGHKKGAFTGAIQDKDGYFKMAHRGTLFLDEVGDIPQHLQVKLLRAIEDGKIVPVGATSPIEVDVRIIAATNRDLTKEMEKGNFREDLYYRLNVVEIKLPSLNERREDIPLLVDHFIKKYNKELNRRILGTDNETMRILMNYQYKGGIRELENVIERALILCEGEYITKQDLPPNMIEKEYEINVPDRLKEAIATFEKRHIMNILRRTKNNKEEAAKILDISLSSLYRKVDELAIKINSD